MRSKIDTFLVRTVGMTVLLGLLAAGCEAYEQEQQIVSVVNDGIALLENRSVGKSLRLTTRDFVAQPGRLGKNAVSARLFKFFRTNGKIEILHPSPEVELQDGGNSALVSMPFVVAKDGVTVESLDDLANDPEAWADAAAEYTEVQRVDISMARENDRWLVRTVRFQAE